MKDNIQHNVGKMKIKYQRQNILKSVKLYGKLPYHRYISNKNVLTIQGVSFFFSSQNLSIRSMILRHNKCKTYYINNHQKNTIKISSMKRAVFNNTWNNY